jgi:hypothetical protein
MQKTKQQKIQELEKELTEKEEGIKQLADELLKIADALSINSYYDNERVKKIIPTIVELKSQKISWQEKCKSFEGMIDERVQSLSGENARLWYLVRAITNDKTLEGEKSNHQDYRNSRSTPFDRADF